MEDIRLRDAIFYDNIWLYTFQMCFETVPFTSDHTQSDQVFKTNVEKCWEKRLYLVENPNS